MLLLYDDKVGLERFERVMKDHTGASKVIYKIVTHGPNTNSFISSDVVDRLLKAMKSEKSLKNFIFNPGSFIEGSISYDG